MSDYVQVFAPKAARPLEEVLVEVFAKYGIARLGGATGAGWSAYSTLQRCPHLYRRKYLDGVQGEPMAALEIGSCYHAFRAVAAYAEIHGVDLSPEGLREDLLAGGADPGVLAEAWRLNEAYECRYEVDYLQPLAVEVVGEHKGFTCRWDLIAKVDEAQVGVVPGTYIVEHKTSARLDNSYLDAWKSDGEIIGQIMIYEGGKYRREWGPLAGVIVNVISKEKMPRFERLILPPQAWQTKQHLRDLKHWRSLRNRFEKTGKWPRSRASCAARYGLCALFSECADGEGCNV